MKRKCIHWWMIETAEGTASKAFCRKCGKKTVFLNSLGKQENCNFVDSLYVRHELMRLKALKI